MFIQPPPSKKRKILSEQEKFNLVKKNILPSIPLFSEQTGNNFENSIAFLKNLKLKLLKNSMLQMTQHPLLLILQLLQLLLQG